MTDYKIYACCTQKVEGKVIKAGRTVERSTSESYIVKRCEELQDKGYNVSWESYENYAA